MLVLHPTTLLNLFINFNILCDVESLWFFNVGSCRLTNRDNLFFSFPIECLLLLLFCLIALVRTSSTILNRSGGNRLPCLVPNLKGKAYRHSPLSVMSAVGFSYVVFMMLKLLPSISSLLSNFIMQGCRILSMLFLKQMRFVFPSFC